MIYPFFLLSKYLLIIFSGKVVGRKSRNKGKGKRHKAYGGLWAPTSYLIPNTLYPIPFTINLEPYSNQFVNLHKIKTACLPI